MKGHERDSESKSESERGREREREGEGEGEGEIEIRADLGIGIEKEGGQDGLSAAWFRVLGSGGQGLRVKGVGCGS